LSRLHARAVAVLVAAAAAGGACRGGGTGPLVTYFHAENALSLRYPAGWTAHLAEQGNLRYRYFRAPDEGGKASSVTVTLVTQPLTGTLDDYARELLGGLPPQETRDEARGPVKGRRFRAQSADGARRHSLLLLQEGTRAFGLHAQGDAAAFAAALPGLETIEGSFGVERPDTWADQPNADLAFALRLPDSWTRTRSLAGNGSYLTQYLSPPVGIDPGGQTVHVNLTVTVEPAPGDGTPAAARLATRAKLGDAFKLTAEAPWRDGLQDVFLVETPIAVSRTKRFYRTSGGRAYGLTFESREDVFPRVARWCDLIASTLRVGPEVAR
jgi:hypothetical protein